MRARESRPVGREARQRQGRPLLEAEVGGQRPDVLGRQHDVFGKGAGVGHAQHHKVAGLHAGVVAPAQAGVDEHAGAHGGCLGWHPRAVGGYHTGAIGPQGAGQLNAGILAFLNKHVAVVEGGGVELHQDFAGAGRGRGHFPHGNGLVNGIELESLHG